MSEVWEKEKYKNLYGFTLIRELRPIAELPWLSQFTIFKFYNNHSMEKIQHTKIENPTIFSTAIAKSYLKQQALTTLVKIWTTTEKKIMEQFTWQVLTQDM